MKDFQSTINEIKEKTDIVDVIGQYVTLEKKGSNYVGLCPFHDDKNPSLTVSPSKKIYTCFSCHATGNVITFIEKFKKISFSEALKELGDRVGVSVTPTKQDLEYQKNKKYYDIIAETEKFYHFYLKNTSEGLEAIEYLKSRMLTEDVIDRFHIGLASKEPDLVYRMLLDKGFLELDMLEAGVVKSGASYYDVFRSRIIFPISDLNGRFVGFSGRKYLKDSTEAKYINSAENVIFKKGNILYNYHEALQEIKKLNSVYVFEGFMDVIAAYRAGINNTVATMGTAFTLDQIRALKRITNNITLCYDGDQPGIESTKRAIKLLVQNDIDVSCIILPVGLDPDEYINKFGKEALNNLLVNQKISAIDYIYEIYKRNLIKSDLSTVETFKKEIFSFLRLYKSNLIIEAVIKRMSEDLEVSINGLLEDFNSTKRFSTDDFYIPASKPRKKSSIQEIRFNANMKSYDRLQKQLIKMAMKFPEKCLEIESRFNNNYYNEANRDIMLEIHQYYTIHNLIDEEVVKAKLPNDEVVSIFEQILEMDVPSDVSQVEIMLTSFERLNKNKLFMGNKQSSENYLDDLIKHKKSIVVFQNKGGNSDDN